MLVSFLYSPKTLHLAFQSGFRRTACQRRSSRGRLAGTLWPDQDQDNDDDDDFEEGLIKEFFSCLPTTFKDMGNTSIYGEREDMKRMTLILMVTSWPGRAFTPSLQSPPSGACNVTWQSIKTVEMGNNENDLFMLITMTMKPWSL